ncbi:MAG: ribonuclease III [Alphaproteobacteria bacterium]|nr:ribonuclease III [Alphaproteobacteria bacterium]MBR6685012.1 ribonuclease III [Alphaproteobacteria bacterium]
MIKLNYKFKNPELMQLAMIQSGVDAVHNNERLEFIGDRVLGLSVADLLYAMYPNETEGELARRHAMLVSTETLAKVAKDVGIDKQIKHGHMTAGRIQHILADAMEATLGAIYLDGGFDAARNVIVPIWRDLAAADVVAPKDPKTRLQELVQQLDSGNLPVYEYLEPAGASHSPVFTVRVTAMQRSATGNGTSKKAASIDAAEKLLKILAI